MKAFRAGASPWPTSGLNASAVGSAGPLLLGREQVQPAGNVGSGTLDQRAVVEGSVRLLRNLGRLG